MKKKPILIDKSLLKKTVPHSLITAEKVEEKIMGKKIKPKHKKSTKYKAAIRNYRNAATRFKRAETLLEKHYKILNRFIKKYS